MGKEKHVSVSFPCNVPLKGTRFCAAGTAIAAVKIIAAIGRQILDLVIAFICAPC
jgi:hypothetical protein